MSSARRWMFLLGLAALLLLSASQAESSVPNRRLSCCEKSGGIIRRGFRITECYEQKARDGCNHHAFLVINKEGEEACIRPNTKWLKKKIENGTLDCPPDVTPV